MKINVKKSLPWILFLIVASALVSWILLSKRVTEEELTSYDEKISEALMYYENMEYSTAMNTFYDATKIIPEKVNAYEGIVDILLNKNRADDAKEIIEKSASKVSKNDQAKLYTLLGNFYYENKEYSLALSTYEKSLGIGVSNPKGELGYAKASIQMEALDTAKKSLEKNIYEDNLLYEAKLVLSYLYSLDDVEKAKEIIKSQEPSDSWNIYYEEIEGVLNSLTDDTKFNATKLSRVYINNDYPYLAVKVLEPIEEDIGEYLEGLYFLGRGYYEHANYNRAIEILDKASLIGGLELEIFWTQARAYLENSDLDNAINKYERAVIYAGEEIDKYLTSEYIELLIENNQKLKAEEVIKKILNYSDNSWVYLLTINTYYSLENSEKVDFYIDKLGSMDLDDESKKEYLYWKAKIMIEKGGVSDIEEVLTELLNLDKYNPYYYLLLGKLEFANSNRENSINALEKSIEYDLSYEVTDEASKLLSRIE